jgi:pimeloyl-[acyl-carrier protein] methyl ester esterase
VETLLLIHGFATGPAVWKKQIEELSRVYNIITDEDQMAGCDSLFVAGWSLGGWRAIEIGAQHPQKVKGLILISAFAKYLKSDDYPGGTPAALLRKLERKFAADYRQGLRYFYDLIFRSRELDYLIDALPLPASDEIKRWFDKLENEDKRESLGAIRLPVLLIHGDDDQISPVENSKFMQEKIPHSELCVLSGVGHAPMLEAPQVFNSRLQKFIKSHAG